MPDIHINLTMIYFFLALSKSSLCFPCLEKMITKYTVFPVSWSPCHFSVFTTNNLEVFIFYFIYLYGRSMKALTVVPQTFNLCSYTAWIIDTMTLDLSDTGLCW